MMDLKTLKELIKLMVSNDLTELDLQDKEEQVRLKRGIGQQAVHVAPQYTSAPPPQPAGGTVPAVTVAGAGDQANDGLVAITSPMVGTFYSASSPDSAPFATVGTRVDDETVVCLIEAMKVFNEIKAETKGTIEKILIESGESVEFGQPLFLIRP